MGNYGVILSLLGCLDNGISTKQLVDRAIDACTNSVLSRRHVIDCLHAIFPGDHVVNLREEIIVHRLRYSITNLDDKQRDAYIDKAVRALEK